MIEQGCDEVRLFFIYRCNMVTVLLCPDSQNFANTPSIPVEGISGRIQLYMLSGFSRVYVC